MTNDVYRAHTFEDLVNTLPTFFGFVPRESIIGLVVHGDRCRFGFRLRHDVPAPGEEESVAAELAAHLVANAGDGVFVIAVSSDAARARTMAVALRDALPERLRRLTIWADDRLLWADVPGFSIEGEPYVLSDHHESRVRAVARGQVILPDRSALVDEVAGPTGDRRRWLEHAHDEVVERFMARVLRTDPAVFVEQERRDVARLVGRALDGEDLRDGELVELAVRVSPRQVRDDSWARIDRENASAMRALWSSVARVAADDVAPAALCLTAFAAWQSGDGARALVALDRALTLEPDYRMGNLLMQTLQAGIHPDRWSSPARSA